MSQDCTWNRIRGRVSVLFSFPLAHQVWDSASSNYSFFFFLCSVFLSSLIVCAGDFKLCAVLWLCLRLELEFVCDATETLDDHSYQVCRVVGKSCRSRRLCVLNWH